MFKIVAKTVGPAQKASPRIFTLELEQCNNLQYIESVNSMYGVTLQVPAPSPLSKDVECPSFLAMQYLENIESLVQQSAKENKTEKELVKSLNSYFLLQFQDLQHIQLSVKVHAAKENWKQGSSSGHTQHHLFPKGQIAKLAESLYKTLLSNDPKKSQGLFDVMGIPTKIVTTPENDQNLANFIKHLMRFGFNLKEGPAPESRTADPGSKPDFIPCIEAGQINIKDKYNFLGWLALFYDFQNKCKTVSKDIKRNTLNDYHEINNEYGTLVALYQVPKAVDFTYETMKFAAQMFGACRLTHKKVYRSTWESQPGNFPNHKQFIHKCTPSLQVRGSFSSPSKISSKRSPMSATMKRDLDNYTRALAKLERSLHETNTRINEIQEEKPTIEDVKLVSKTTYLPDSFDLDFFIDAEDEDDHPKVTKEEKVKSQKDKFLTVNENGIVTIIKYEYDEDLTVKSTRNLTYLIKSYPALKTEILTAIVKTSKLSQEIKDLVCKDLQTL